MVSAETRRRIDRLVMEGRNGQPLTLDTVEERRQRQIRDVYRADRALLCHQRSDYENMLQAEGMTFFPGWRDMPLGRGWGRKWSKKTRVLQNGHTGSIPVADH